MLHFNFRSCIRFGAKWKILVFILLISAGKLSAQIDTSKMAWPPGMTDKQKAQYMRFFGNFEHPEAYYRLPVAQQRQFDINMHKYKSLKTKGWIMAGVGALLIGVGVAIPEKSDDYTDVVFYSIGGAMVLGSIPLFVSSSKRAKQAQLIIAGAPAATSFYKVTPQLGIRLQL
jgi:uncharacterized membrane protein